MISALLFVTLNGQILGGWVIILNVTRRVMSVTQSTGVCHIANIALTSRKVNTWYLLKRVKLILWERIG